MLQDAVPLPQHFLARPHGLGNFCGYPVTAFDR